MRTPENPGRRRTLNEVLVAELRCLRPGLITELSATEPGKQPFTPATPEQDEASQTQNLHDLYGHIGKLASKRSDGKNGYAHLSALCLSGGGIRSATFNLGVLQVLAKIGLLGKFDYLSSVAGGGYIAGWLRAWMHRRGVAKVVTELGGHNRNTGSSSNEAAPVSNLRDYSNYLTPRLGLFSGDTWSVVATVMRNLLLNWLVLVPLLGMVTGIPLLFLQYIRTQGLPSDLPMTLLALAVVIETIASVLIYRARRFAKSPDMPQGYFMFRCVIPVCLAAAALSAAGIGLQLPWATVQNPSGSLLPLWEFAGVWSIVVPVLGWTISEVIARTVPSAKEKTTGRTPGTAISDPQMETSARQVSAATELAALIVSGMIGAALFVTVVRYWFFFLYNHPALYVILAFPLLLGLYLLSRVVFVGITSLNDERGDLLEKTPPDPPESTSPNLRSRISSNDADREWWSRLSGWILLIITSWVTVTGICLIGCYLPNVIWDLFQIAKDNHETVTYVVKGVVTVVGLLSGAAAAVTASSSQTPGPGEGSAAMTPRRAKLLLGVAASVFLVSFIMMLSWSVKALAAAIISGPPGHHLFALKFSQSGIQQPVSLASTVEFAGLLLSLAVVALLAGRIANVNRFSLQGMYRNRLVRAYLGASNCPVNGVDQRREDPFTGFSLSDNFPLYRLCRPPETPGPKSDSDCAQPERPLSIINTTLNLVHGQKLAWQQRKAESFSMTPLFCGNRTEGYRDSREYGGPGGVTVGTAMSISGAAANPSMGYSSSPVLGFLMAMFNVRLGAWLGNTNQHGDGTFSHPGPRHAVIPLFAEMFGLTTATSPYINLSDGGHFDNLGLYEIVLRRCRQVLVSDAGQDGSFSFEDLGNSIRKIRIDFGINITFDKIHILPNTPEKEGLCCAIGRIHYSDVDGTSAEDDGVLIYIKPTLRGRGAQFPYDIYSYSRESITFPHESMVDQRFSESQFESYRALGSHIVTQLTGSLDGRTDTSFDDFHTSVSLYVTGDTPGAHAAPTGPHSIPDPEVSGKAA